MLYNLKGQEEIENQKIEKGRGIGHIVNKFRMRCFCKFTVKKVLELGFFVL